MPRLLRLGSPARILTAALSVCVLSSCATNGSTPGAAPRGATGESPAATGAPPSARATRSAAGTPTPSSPSVTGGLRAAPGRSGAHVTLRAPGYDAPGSLISLVATVSDPGGSHVDFTLTVPGGTGTCEGPTWRHSRGISQSCWVTLPRRPGKTTIAATADLKPAGAAAVRTDPGTVVVEGKGPVTDPVDVARRDAITRCGNTTGRVWLTFDDQFLSTQRMDSMLATLRAKNVRARFFALGTWARARPASIARLRAEGHLVENHTLSHEPLSSQSDAALHAQIAGGPRGDAPALLRPGYGAGAYAARVVDAAAGLGFNTCYWTVDPRDWAGPTPEQLIDRVVHGDVGTPPVRAGGVVLMHMTGKHTAQALPGLIDAIRDAGLTLDPLR